MISVTMEQLLAFKNGSTFIGNTNLPLKGAYKITKIKQEVDKEIEFYTEKFQEIVNTYAQKNENGSLKFSEDGEQILIQDGKIEECNKALEDLQKLEVQIENYGLTIDDLGDIECTPDDLESLIPFMN